mgnify:CR=1 FL=1
MNTLTPKLPATSRRRRGMSRWCLSEAKWAANPNFMAWFLLSGPRVLPHSLAGHPGCDNQQHPLEPELLHNPLRQENSW